VPPQKNDGARPRSLWRRAGFRILLLIWVDNRRGERAWAEYKASAKARGIKLYQAEYAQPTIPDEENYAAAPFIVEMGDLKTSDANTKRLQLPQMILHSPAEWKAARVNPLIGWQNAFVREKWISSASDDPAADVLTALKRFDEILSQVREASQRPLSQWPVHLSRSDRQICPHIRPLAALGAVLTLRAKALLAQHRGDEALGEIRHALRIARSVEHQATNFPFLLCLSTWNKTLEVAEYGIASGLWDTAQLRTLPEEWTGIDVLGDLVFALDSQRIDDNAYYEILAEDRPRLAELLTAPGETPSLRMTVLCHLIPTGRVRFAQVDYNRRIDLDLEDIDPVHRAIDPRFCRSVRLPTRSSPETLGMTYFLNSTVGPSNESTTYKAAATHTRIQQLTLQCALARYRNEHGNLPGTLDELVPDFIERIPRDVMDGQLLRYRRTEDGGCLIWSVGANRIDDGGKTGAGGKPKRHPRNKRKGDWVSVLPPIRFR
jgi:hypothetical protein